MARRSSRRRQVAAPPKLSSLLLLLLVLTGMWLYDNGYFDRWLDGGTEPASPAARGPGRNDLPGASASVETDTLRGYTGRGYQVYFTKPPYPEGRGNRGDGLDKPIAVDIAAARESVDLAVFDLDVARIVDALIEAKQNGAAVRVAIDAENLETPEVAKAVGDLEAVGIPVFLDERDAFMHNKFVVIDGRVVWTGSANFTVNDIFRNNNNMLRIVHPDLAANYTAKMDDLMADGGGPGGGSVLVSSEVTVDGTPMLNMFAPDDAITDEVVARIAAADESIDLLAFAFTSDPVADALIAAHERGVSVRVIMESRNTRGSGSDFNIVQEAGIDIRRDGNCYIMHNKSIVIDGDTVITGSFNFTRAAQAQNDENVLIIKDQGLAERFGEEFERLYAQALEPTRCG